MNRFLFRGLYKGIFIQIIDVQPVSGSKLNWNYFITMIRQIQLIKFMNVVISTGSVGKNQFVLKNVLRIELTKFRKEYRELQFLYTNRFYFDTWIEYMAVPQLQALTLCQTAYDLMKTVLKASVEHATTAYAAFVA